MNRGAAATAPGPALTPSRPGARHLAFVLVGAYNTVFGYAAFAALHVALPDVGYLAVLLPAYAAGIVNAFVAYRLFVFRVRGHVLRDLARFAVVYLGALAVNAVALPFAVEVLGLGVLVAQALVVGITACVSYVGHTQFSFRREGA